MEKEVVIFGASEGGIKTLHALRDMGICVKGLADNNSAKWGKSLEGLEIYAPEFLKQNDYLIVVSSIHRSEIIIQLRDMGIDEDRIIYSREELILSCVKDRILEFDYLKDESMVSSFDRSTDASLLIECDAGFGIGGIQRYTDSLIRGMNQYSEIEVKLLCRDRYDDGSKIPQYYKENAVVYQYSCFNYWNMLHELIKIIIEQGISNLLLNFELASPISIAVYIMKEYLPEYLNVIYYIHGNDNKVLRSTKLLSKNLDVIVCVSEMIQSRAINEYGITQEKLVYFASPMICENYSAENKYKDSCIMIGYAGRLENVDKRTDLLIPLIEIMENKKVAYKMKIAGLGPNYIKIKEYLHKNSLEDKIELLGLVEYKDMAQFWKSCEIILNLSDSEGTCLSMVEGMAYGCVPIVTDVSGTKEYVDCRKNGYIFDNTNLEDAAELFRHLNVHREILEKFGLVCMDIVRKKCSLEGYISNFLTLLV